MEIKEMVEQSLEAIDRLLKRRLEEAGRGDKVHFILIMGCPDGSISLSRDVRLVNVPEPGDAVELILSDGNATFDTYAVKHVAYNVSVETWHVYLSKQDSDGPLEFASGDDLVAAAVLLDDLDFVVGEFYDTAADAEAEWPGDEPHVVVEHEGEFVCVGLLTHKLIQAIGPGWHHRAS